MIRVFMLVILITISASADFSNTNVLNFYNIHIHGGKTNNEKVSNTLNYISIEPTVNYSTDNYWFVFTPIFYKYDTLDGNELVHHNFNKKWKKQNAFIRSLYMSYTDKNMIYGVGFIPFSNSFPMEYTKDLYSDGEGLSTISDHNPLSAFVKIIDDKNSYLLSVNHTGKDYPVGNYMPETLKGSSGIRLMHTYIDTKIKVINEFSAVYLTFEGEHYAKQYNIGTGLSYDDSSDSGWIVYDVFGLSLMDSKMSRIKNRVLDAKEIPQSALTTHPESFDFEDKKIYGASNLFGIRKDFDIFRYDMFLNFEWFHTFNDWTSGNFGNLYNSNWTQTWNIRNDSFFFNYGLTVTKNLFFSMSYAISNCGGAIKTGNPTETDPKNVYSPRMEHSNVYRFNLKYRF